MLIITIIGLCCGALSVLFIVMEINQSIREWSKSMRSLRGIQWVKLPLITLKSWSPLLFDVALTLGVVWLFGMSGMIGTMISLMASAVISGYVYFKRRGSGLA